MVGCILWGVIVFVILSRSGGFVVSLVLSPPGWGDTSSNGDPPTVLQSVSLSVVSDEDCRAVYGSPDVEDSMLCAGGVAGQGGCNGDSGGPLACLDSSGNTYLAGVGSWGYGCALDGYPAVFAEVSAFVSWIEDNAD
ncbi:UNVERIFIED_CONTAM: hypothetical protein GTU68_058105 [Idotea baltica]|nr:hypothetical protein [Idotea baltica]